MGTKTILIAEDREEIRVLLKAIFSESPDYNVFYARDGKEALNMAGTHRPDIVLLDIQMPRMSGLDVCDSIKSDPSLSHTKVLILSGQGQSSDFWKAAEMGADGYMVKPFGTVALLEKVKELLYKSEV